MPTRDALPAVRILAACRPGDKLLFRLGPLSVMSFRPSDDDGEEFADLFRMVAALEVLQAHLGTLVPIPADPLEDEDAMNLMAMAQALSGTPARLPFTGIIMPLRPGSVHSFLSSVPDEPGALYGAPHSIPVTLDGQRYDVPGLALWAPNAMLINRAELAALTADDKAEAVASFNSPDNTHISMIPSPARHWRLPTPATPSSAMSRQSAGHQGTKPGLVVEPPPAGTFGPD